MAGAQVSEPSGLPLPNSAANNTGIKIRCMPFRSEDQKPLFIIDGIPVDTMDIQQLRPEQIASIYVLKDELAMALYGCRASRGVLIITLKPRVLYIQAINSYTQQRLLPQALSVRVGAQSKEKQLAEDGQLEMSSMATNTTLEFFATGYVHKRYDVGRETSDTLTVWLEPIAKRQPELTTASRPVTAVLYPNPAKVDNRLTIQVPATEGKIAISLYGLNGQLIKQVTDRTNNGQISFLLPAAFKGAGIVVVQDEAKNVLLKEKLLIQ